MRGKESQISALSVSNGITPARAGKRVGQICAPRRSGDHPRACGEKDQSAATNTGYQGSPPRVRGKGQYRLDDRMLQGITPARAGKRMGAAQDYVFKRDHPRACGEKFTVTTSPNVTAGSPPRVRGKDFASVKHRIEHGITPARAGKRLKHIPYLLCSCAKHLFTPQFCVDDLCQLAVGHSAVSLNIR